MYSFHKTPLASPLNFQIETFGCVVNRTKSSDFFLNTLVLQHVKCLVGSLHLYHMKVGMAEPVNVQRETTYFHLGFWLASWRYFMSNCVKEKGICVHRSVFHRLCVLLLPLQPLGLPLQLYKSSPLSWFKGASVHLKVPSQNTSDYHCRHRQSWGND